MLKMNEIVVSGPTVTDPLGQSLRAIADRHSILSSHSVASNRQYGRVNSDRWEGSPCFKNIVPHAEDGCTEPKGADVTV